jgi:hypothetical protein
MKTKTVKLNVEELNDLVASLIVVQGTAWGSNSELVERLQALDNKLTAKIREIANV